MSAAMKNIAEEYRPLSMWEYFGYNLLYSIPIVGLIFMIVFALDDSNINRRNFTRSYFIVFLIYAVLLVVLFMTGAMVGIVDTLSGNGS